MEGLSRSSGDAYRRNVKSCLHSTKYLRSRGRVGTGRVEQTHSRAHRRGAALRRPPLQHLQILPQPPVKHSGAAPSTRLADQPASSAVRLVCRAPSPRAKPGPVSHRGGGIREACSRAQGGKGSFQSPPGVIEGGSSSPSQLVAKGKGTHLSSHGRMPAMPLLARTRRKPSKAIWLSVKGEL